MNEQVPKFSFGIDMGTQNIREVVLSEMNGQITVVGKIESPQNGGRSKGVVTNLRNAVHALETASIEIDRMIGMNLTDAYLSINGSNVGTAPTQGGISITGSEITEADVARLKEFAVSGIVPDNRELLDVIPVEYAIAGQGGIRNPIGMRGVKLEMQANVVSALLPVCMNLKEVASTLNINALKLVPTAVAAGRAVLLESQKENGVAVVEMGAATTSVAIFMEGFLQYFGVINVGANHITNDIAISLAVSTEVAEEIKMKYVTAELIDNDKPMTMRFGDESISFTKTMVNSIVEDRLIDIFEHVKKEIAIAGYEKKLPEGVVLTGGGAEMRGIERFAREHMEVATRIGLPLMDVTHTDNETKKPRFAVAIGLALMMNDDMREQETRVEEKPMGFLGKLFGGGR